MVISTVNQVIYNGDGVTVAWPYTFRIIDATDIKLAILEDDGTSTDITSDYYVDKVNSTVYYPGYAPGAEPPEEEQPPVLPAGKKLLIYRQLPVTQEKDLGDKWPFEVIELALDKLTMILQQVYEWWGRCLKISPAAQAEHPGFDMTFPIEAGKSFRVNAAGTGFEVSDDPGISAAAAIEAATIAAAAAASAEAAAAATELQAVWLDTVEDLIAANIPAGNTAGTKGYLALGDGGNALYTVRVRDAGDVDDGGSIIFMDNGNVAELIAGDTISVKMFGAAGDGLSDDTTAFANAIAFANGKKLLVPSGSYAISSAVLADGVAEVEDYGTYTNVKPAYPNTELMFKGFRDMERIGKLDAVPSYVGQGMCYNSTTDRYLVGIITEDNASQKFLIVDPSDLSVESTETFADLGHLNSLTYVPETDEIVVATGRNDWKNISVVNASTYAITEEIANVLDGEVVLAIKYDPVCKVYFAFNHDGNGTYNYYILDTSFSVINSGTFSGPADTSNGLVAYGGTALIYMFASIIEVDYFGNVKHVTNHELRWEFEDADMTPYGIITSANSGGVGYTLLRYKENEIQMSNSIFPISIETYKTATSTDLNLLRNAGQYFVTTDITLEQSIACHYPSHVYNGFMTVFRESLPIANGFVKQILYRIGDGDEFNSNNWQIYSRQYDPNYSAWSNWVRIDSGLVEEGQTSFGSDIAAGNYKDLTINFTVPFKSVPYVQLTMMSTSTSMDYANVSIVVYSVSKTQLVVRGYNGGTGGRNPGVWWKATER